jgi:type I restriction enzyme, S subunit
MERYEEYKKTSVKFLDEIPKHWTEKRMRFIGHLYGGLSGKSANDFNKTGDENNKHFIPFTNIANNLVIDPDNLQTVVIKEDEKQNQVKNDDLFFLMSSETYEDVGKSAVLSQELPDTYLNSFCKGFRITEENIISKFLNYQLHSKQHRHNLLTGANGFTRINLKIDKVKDLFVALPPTSEEQTTIANYLDHKTTEIDELIADKKHLLELYEEEKTAIINQAVTKGINPDATMKDSGIEWLGEIPEHWSSSPLKYLGKFINGYSFKSTEFVASGTRVLKISNIQNMRIDWTDESFINEDYYDTQSNFRVLKDDLVFALTRPIISTGIKVAMMDIDEKILLNQRNSIYRPTEVDVKWIYYLILSANFIQEFDSRIDKTGQQPNISSNDIGNITISIPPSQELTEIIELVDTTCAKIDIEILKVSNLIDLLIEYRTALISEVVTGKIKVTE